MPRPLNETPGADERALREEVTRLNEELLASRDHAIGLEATIVQLKEQLAQAAQREQRRISALQSEIEAMRSSTTWRAGRVIVGPFARLRRRG